ncbi:Hypothetical protein NCS54_00132100 [Fusarium falciforme]|uniref:Hypothetical protein n=1 Tax=Fusarium falciforme TaxID=195108 RepID=UPI0023009B50|nr:Hypothetical protein NCS54_00132100 [Fusarium falciforme]WAO84115.1 Hypothetical protein NCS54_00132100 [Fusarium falciforme]
MSPSYSSSSPAPEQRSLDERQEREEAACRGSFRIPPSSPQPPRFTSFLELCPVGDVNSLFPHNLRDCLISRLSCPPPRAVASPSVD